MNEEFDLNGYQQQNVYEEPSVDDRPGWAAIVSFVLSILSLMGCCCCCTYILIPLSLTFGIVSLANGWKLKGLAIAGIVISGLTAVSIIVCNIMFKEVSDDLMKIYQDPQKYISLYEETGEPPEEFLKYEDAKYDKWWEAMGVEDFDHFYDFLMKEFFPMYNRNSETGGSSSSRTESTSGESSERPPNYGEDPITI